MILKTLKRDTNQTQCVDFLNFVWEKKTTGLKHLLDIWRNLNNN